jgi:hypothetical protein
VAAAAMMRARVLGATLAPAVKVRDTAERDTCASLATSLALMRDFKSLTIGSPDNSGRYHSCSNTLNEAAFAIAGQADVL